MDIEALKELVAKQDRQLAKGNELLRLGRELAREYERQKAKTGGKK